MNSPGPIRSFRVENLDVRVYGSAEAMGWAAGEAAANIIREAARSAPRVPVIFATGQSQFATLATLSSIPDVPWHQVVGFHMDEYLGISDQHPASFRRYLRERLMDKVAMQSFYQLDGSTADPQRTCREYGELLLRDHPQLCLLGIGENGHLAFNDPAEADFQDPADVKIVSLDSQCRQQQVNEGWFSNLADVPQQAVTLTIPALLRVPVRIASVPSVRKARIVRRTLTEEVSTRCPATILRTRPGTTLYLDLDSAAEVP